jgi:glycosyltransferase involved in cell wall biosynthesis
VPDGVDVHRTVTPATRATLESLGVPHDAPVVVQVAQLVGHKDPLNFVRAMARARERVPEVHGLLVGDGPLRAEVEREIHALGLNAAVHLAGYRTDADSLLAAGRK